MRETPKQRQPWMLVSVSPGATSKAATMATELVSAAKCERTAWPRLPTPTRATSCLAAPSRKLPMLSMQASTLYPLLGLPE